MWKVQVNVQKWNVSASIWKKTRQQDIRAHLLTLFLGIFGHIGCRLKNNYFLRIKMYKFILSPKKINLVFHTIYLFYTRQNFFSFSSILIKTKQFYNDVPVQKAFFCIVIAIYTFLNDSIEPMKICDQWLDFF